MMNGFRGFSFKKQKNKNNELNQSFKTRQGEQLLAWERLPQRSSVEFSLTFFPLPSMSNNSR